MHQPKTAEELNKQLNIPYDDLMNELKGLLKLNIISKEGFPTKYHLKEEISGELNRRKEIQEKDPNKLRLSIIIEAKAVSPEILKRELKKIKDALAKEEAFQIYAVKEAEIIESGNHVSSYIEANLSLEDFRAVTRLIFFYAPTSIEVLKPKKLELTADDLQDSLVTMADMVQGYSRVILNHMNKEQLEDFRQNLTKKQ